MVFRVAKGFFVLYKRRGIDEEAFVTEGERGGECTWRPLSFGYVWLVLRKNCACVHLFGGDFSLIVSTGDLIWVES